MKINVILETIPKKNSQLIDFEKILVNSLNLIYNYSINLILGQKLNEESFMKMTVNELQVIKDQMDRLIENGLYDNFDEKEKNLIKKNNDYLKLVEAKKKFEDKLKHTSTEGSIDLPIFNKDELKYINESKESEKNELAALFTSYVSRFTKLLGGTHDKHTEIIRLIVTLTPQNQDTEDENGETCCDRLRGLMTVDLGVNKNHTQAFLIRASKVLLHIISPDSVLKIQTNFEKSLEVTNLLQTDFGSKEAKVEAKSISKEMLLPLINTIGGEDINKAKGMSDEISVLDLAIEYYEKQAEGSNKKLLEKLIGKLFDSYITPDLFDLINNKSSTIETSNKDAECLGRALLALSRLKPRKLFDDQIQKLKSLSDTKARNDKVSVDANDPTLKDNPGVSTRMQKIAKIIMVPMLKDLKELNEILEPGQSEKQESKKSEINVDKNGKRYSHHDSFFMDQSIFDSGNIDTEFFVQELQGILHASLFADYNQVKDRELRGFEDPYALAPVQAVDSIHQFIKHAFSAADKNVSIENLKKDAETKYLEMYPNYYKDKARTERNILLIQWLVVTFIVLSVAAIICCFVPGVAPLFLAAVGAKSASLWALFTASLGVSVGPSLMVAGSVRAVRPNDYYLKNNEPVKNANGFFNKVSTFHQDRGGKGALINHNKKLQEKEEKTVKEKCRKIGNFMVTGAENIKPVDSIFLKPGS